jgi:MIP family channel proteins
MFNWKVFAVEFIGTFALVFAGSAAGIYTDDLMVVALAHGLTLAVLVYLYGHISGSHVNPAVTLGMAVNGSIKWGEAIVYWLAQFSGAVVAAILLRTFIAEANVDLFENAATSGILVTRAVPPFIMAIAVEAMLTFFLMTSFLQVSVDRKAGSFGWLVIGLTLTFAILAGGPLTGATLNPARSFGPALFTKALFFSKLDYLNPTLYQVYFLGPFLGALAAVGMNKLLKSNSPVDEWEVDSTPEQVKNPFMGKPTVRKNRR